MSINLVKNQSINLTKAAPALKKITVGLGWGKGADLDASAFGCKYNADGAPRLVADEFFVFFNNLQSPDGGIVHAGDNRTGDGDGDDEVITVDLTKLDTRVQEVAFVVTIYGGSPANFGAVSDAYIRVLDADTQKELAVYNLTDQFKDETGVQFGSLFLNDQQQWEFKAVGAGYPIGLGDFVEGYKQP